MTMEQAVETIENGILFMEELEEDYDIFSTGEMGIRKHNNKLCHFILSYKIKHRRCCRKRGRAF